MCKSLLAQIKIFYLYIYIKKLVSIILLININYALSNTILTFGIPSSQVWQSMPSELSLQKLINENFKRPVHWLIPKNLDSHIF